jgi:hypothetical protein
MAALGKPGSWEHQTEAKVPAPRDIAASLGLAEGDLFVRTKYEFMTEGRPVQLSASWEPARPQPRRPNSSACAPPWSPVSTAPTTPTTAAPSRQPTSSPPHAHCEIAYEVEIEPRNDLA